LSSISRSLKWQE